MSYNIVKKNGSTCLVHKFRDPSNPKKVVEKYLLSMGVQTDARHKEIRLQVNELAQEDRISFCQHSGLVVEVKADIPRRKAPTGDIREQPVKKTRKPRVKKEKVETEKAERIMWEQRPYLKAGYLKTEAQKDACTNTKTERRTMTKQQIDNRILKIKGDIKFAKKVIAHKRNVQTFSASQQAGVRCDIDYYTSVVDSGSKAIKILQKEKKAL